MRLEYPNPQFRRNIWQSLNGEWDFHFDDNCEYNLKIQVPFAYQSAASGIGDVKKHEVLWYKRKFILSEELVFVAPRRITSLSLPERSQASFICSFIIARFFSIVKYSFFIFLTNYLSVI